MSTGEPRPWFPSPRRALAGGAMLAMSVLMVAAGWSGTSGAATDPIPVELKGAGSWGPYQELVTWQDDLYGADHPIDLSYTTNGSYEGRQEFLQGDLDFVISGTPFTTEELAKVKGGAAGLIDVPIQVEAMAMLLAVPLPEGFVSVKLVCDPYDPETPDPDACIVRTPYDGAIRIPNRNLAAMLFKYTGPGTRPLSSWNHSDVLAAMGVPNFTLDPLAGPAPVVRSEPSSSNYFLQKFAQTAAPDVWAGVEAGNSDVEWEPIGERLPRILSASRQGVDQQSLQLGLGGADPASGAISGFTKGILAPVPPSAKPVVAGAFPSTQLTDIELKNASGEWVGPTPDSISKAVEAGGDTPLYALTNPASGAYPLVWVNHLYAPSTGLTATQTEALATAIRYLATDGQGAAKPVGEGKLSAALVAKALEGANKLVTSNCTGSDRKIVEATSGTYDPDLPGIKAIGKALHCEPVGTQPTTTTTTQPPVYPTDTTPYVDPGIPVDTGSIDIPVDPGLPTDTIPTDTIPTDTTPTTTAAPKANGAAPTTTGTTIPPVTALPMAVPDGKPEGYDQMAALMMGGSIPLLFGSGLKRILLGLFL